MASLETKEFFSVDRGAFRCAAVEGLNCAVAHLIMARGTGRDNRTTQWSVNSIEKNTGISRPNAKKAVEMLLARGIWMRVRAGNHPIYEAVPGDQIEWGPFTNDEIREIVAFRAGNFVLEKSRNLYRPNYLTGGNAGVRVSGANP